MMMLTWLNLMEQWRPGAVALPPPLPPPPPPLLLLLLLLLFFFFFFSFLFSFLLSSSCAGGWLKRRKQPPSPQLCCFAFFGILWDSFGIFWGIFSDLLAICQPCFSHSLGSSTAVEGFPPSFNHFWEILLDLQGLLRDFGICWGIFKDYWGIFPHFSHFLSDVFESSRPVEGFPPRIFRDLEEFLKDSLTSWRIRGIFPYINQFWGILGGILTDFKGFFSTFQPFFEGFSTSFLGCWTF